LKLTRLLSGVVGKELDTAPEGEHFEEDDEVWYAEYWKSLAAFSTSLNNRVKGSSLR
jgi:hypothetical protein